jgi:hypothetical protein
MEKGNPCPIMILTDYPPLSKINWDGFEGGIICSKGGRTIKFPTSTVASKKGFISF